MRPSRLLCLVALLLSAAGTLARADADPSPAPKAVAPASGIPVAIGQPVAEVVRILGKPTGSLNGRGTRVLFYPDGEVEIREDQVSRIRWKGVTVRAAATPVRLERMSASELSFVRSAPDADVRRTREEKAAEEARLRQANSKLKVVSSQETDNLIRSTTEDTPATTPAQPAGSPAPAAPPQPAPEPPVAPPPAAAPLTGA